MGRMMSVAGASLIAAAAFLWGAGAWVSGDVGEIPLCILFGMGFILIAFRVNAPSPRGVPVGLALAALPATYWAFDALRLGRLDSPWVLVGVGVDLAFVLALASPRGGWFVWTSRSAFALVGVASAAMLVQDDLTFWSSASVLALAGGALLALAPPRAPASGEALPAASG